VLKHVIRPAVEECGYEAIRADEISEPGIISNQVIQHLVNDALVIADLTGRNPNVFYELAIRHTIQKPLVQVVQSDEPLPFDVAGTRTISFDHTDLDSVEIAKSQIVQQIQSLEKSTNDQESPISLALDLQALRSSENPQSATLADLAERLSLVQGTVLNIEDLMVTKCFRTLSDLSDKLQKVTLASQRAEKISGDSDLSELGVTVQELYDNLTKTISEILSDVRVQQTKLAERIMDEFNGQSDSATEIIKDVFAKEIYKFVKDTQEQEQLLERLIESFMHGMKTMGEYQQINIENETRKSTQEIETRIKESISSVLNEVDKLHEKVMELPSLSCEN